MAQFNFTKKLDIDETQIEQTDVMTGDNNRNRYLYYQLKLSMLHAKKIDIIVSFLMESGVRLILNDLKTALDRGVQIRILTGNYLGITQPSALYLLKNELGNRVDMRFYNDKHRSFHPKAYIFHYENYEDIYIGSSNISRSALTSGIEWNYRLNSQDNHKDFVLFYDTFQDLFENHSIIIDDNELKRYSKNWHKPAVSKDLARYDAVEDNSDTPVRKLFQPRGPQIEALYALADSRSEGATKGLVHAATGIGKTYLAAFDSAKYQKVLFVAHREEILKQATISFRNVRQSNDYGFFYGKQKDKDKSVIFASVATLGRSEYLTENYFAPDYFDYLIIDEAHNLVDRARDMYSAVLIKEDVLETKRLLKTKSKKITASLESVNRALLDLKRQCDELLICTLSMTDALLGRLLRLQSVMDEFLQDPSFSEKKLSEEQFSQLLDFYFNIRSFVNVYELVDEHYLIYCDYNDNSNFCVHLQCMNPSANLEQYLAMGRSAIFFSATLLPIQYYREQLASRPEDYAIYAPSPFPGHNRLLLVGRDVSTKYSRRGAAMYARIVDYILRFVHARSGNYMVFVPSYKMLQDIYDMIASSDASQDLTLLTQNATMDEQEREEFLAHFSESPTTTTVGLCVLGGIFSEGIDLKAERLIGAVIVGTGLPMVCNENELYRQFFDGEISSFSTGSENDEATIRNTRHGFSYAYQYPGMNKVLQAAGRVIRTEQDYGCILLLDDRFLQGSYQSLFPREWFPHYTVTPETMTEHLLKFWEAHST